MKITIPFSLPSLNEYIAACRENPKKGGAMKRKWDNAVAMAIRHQIKRQLREPVIMDYMWVERNRRRERTISAGLGARSFRMLLCRSMLCGTTAGIISKTSRMIFALTRSALASKSRYGRAWNDNQRPLRHQPSAHQAR